MMLGIGIGPVISRILFSLEVNVSVVFFMGACLSGFSALLFIRLGSKEKNNNNAIHGTASLTLRDARSVFSSDALIPILMIAIGGSIFGCLTNYQTVIAEAKSIDFSLFFLIFAITIVVSRLGLASKLNSLPPYPTAIALLLIMCAALASYSYLPQSSFTFIITTIIFGVGYGLTYSVLNGIVANIKQTDHLQAALLIFPLAYFIGLYGFPYIGGWLLVRWDVTTLLVTLMLLGLLKMGLAMYGFFRHTTTHKL
jgi:predicted MFS family arabinose efflux permease